MGETHHATGIRQRLAAIIVRHSNIWRLLLRSPLRASPTASLQNYPMGTITRTVVIFAASLAAVAALVSAADWTPTTLPAAAPTGAAADSPVWYRCYIRVPANMVTPAAKDLWRDSIVLNLGGITGPFTVYLNGQKIGESDALPEGVRRR